MHCLCEVHWKLGPVYADDTQGGMSCSSIANSIIIHITQTRKYRITCDKVHCACEEKLKLRRVYAVDTQGGKLLKYCKYNRVCECAMVMFVIMWFVTRLLIFPFWLALILIS